MPGPQTAQTEILAEIAGILRHAQRVLAMCHIHPDGDAIGSLLALGWLLKQLPGGPAVTLACADPVPPALAFLPGAGEIVSDPPVAGWDAVVSLDASDPARLGGIFHPASYGGAALIVLDHHVTNLRFGALNLVDVEAAATAQVVVALADALGVPIAPEAALCLQTGLVTDTLAFRTSNVDARMLATAARLASLGAAIAPLVQRTLVDQPLAIMRLWGPALSGLRYADGVLWTEITRAMRAAAGVTDDGDGKLVSHLISASEARVAAVFNELADGTVEVDLRARPGHNVATVALSLGGGGHPAASGCTLPGTLAEVEGRVLPLLVVAAANGGSPAAADGEGAMV
jgi:bifunctional oligoribonuclease and PAP phosphatase NrnA